MRKILITLLTISVIVISLSVTAFASTSSIYLTEPVISENVATTYLVLNPVDTGLAGITIDYTVTGGTAVVTDTEALKALDSTMTMEAGTNITFMTGDAGIASLGDATQIVKFEITRDGEATSTTVDLSVSEAYDSNMDELAVTETDLTFNWVAAPTM